MAEPQVVPLVFGQGLDRETGAMATRPGSMEQIKNVELFQGKAQVRHGYRLASALVLPAGATVTHVLAIQEMRTTQEAMVVVLGDDGAVHALVVDKTGTHATYIAKWGDLPAGATTPPRILTASSYGEVVLGHDESVFLQRLPTVYYDASVSTLTHLTGTLDGVTEEDIPYRGVQRYLNYLVGWAYGSASERDRPEVLRISQPGQPLEFAPDAYFIIGERNDAVLAAHPTGSVLLVLKGTEIHRITGYAAANFGSEILDPNFGVLTSRLAVTVSDTCFFWSATGPRMCNGQGPSQDIAIPLDLGGPDPLGLVAESDLGRAFAYWNPERRSVHFVFGRRQYVLSLRGQPWKWSYFETGVELLCAGLVADLPTAASVTPVGYPSFVPQADWPAAISDFWVQMLYDNHDPTPGSVIEVWLRPQGGAWPATPHTTAPVDTGKLRDLVRVEDLTPGLTYDVALRYRAGAFVTPGYEGATPDDWVATPDPTNRGTFTTTATRRRITSAVWSRVDADTEQVQLTIDGGSSDTATQIEVAVLDPVAGTYGAFAAVAGSPDGGALPLTHDYVVAAGQEEHWLKFRARSDDGASNVGPWSLEKEAWTGPQQPLGNDDGNIDTVAIVGEAPRVTTFDIYKEDPQSGQPTIIDDTVIGGLVAWVNATSTYETEVWIDLGDGSGYARQGTAAAGQHQLYFTQARVVGTMKVKVRHKATWTDGVTVDYSDYTHEAQVEVRAP